MTKEEYIKTVIDLSIKLKSTDSAKEKKELEDELGNLNRKYGHLIQYHIVKLKSGKIGRLKYAYWDTYSVYFNRRTNYKWSNNYVSLNLNDIKEWISEEAYNDILEETDKLSREKEQIENKINGLQNKLDKINRKIIEITEDYPYKVDVESFEETDKVNHSVYTFDGSKSYIEETYCEKTGVLIQS